MLLRKRYFADGTPIQVSDLQQYGMGRFAQHKSAVTGRTSLIGNPIGAGERSWKVPADNSSPPPSTPVIGGGGIAKPRVAPADAQAGGSEGYGGGAGGGGGTADAMGNFGKAGLISGSIAGALTSSPQVALRSLFNTALNPLSTVVFADYAIPELFMENKNPLHQQVMDAFSNLSPEGKIDSDRDVDSVAGIISGDTMDAGSNAGTIAGEGDVNGFSGPGLGGNMAAGNEAGTIAGEIDAQGISFAGDLNDGPLGQDISDPQGLLSSDPSDLASSVLGDRPSGADALGYDSSGVGGTGSSGGSYGGSGHAGDAGSRGGDNYGGDGGGGGGSKVLCGELNRQGILPNDLYAADLEYAEQIDPVIVAGYHFWAKPLVRKMRKSPLLTLLVSYFVIRWATHMAFVMGVSRQDSFVGRWMEWIFVPICWFIGMAMRFFGEKAHKDIITV